MPFDADRVGWGASAVLLSTLVIQVSKQFRRDERVSLWTFVGQAIASAGFLWYSLLVDNMVFVVTNSLLIVTALFGGGLFIARRAEEPAQDSSADPARTASDAAASS